MIEEKDIDLAHLLSKLKSFISSKIYIIIISLLVVLIGIYAINVYKPKEYSSKIVISSNQYPYAISEEILNELVEAVLNNKNELLHKKLGISDGDISTIDKMSLSEVRLTKNEMLESAVSISFTVQSEDNRVRLDSVFANYMNRRGFVQKMVYSKKRSLEKYIQNIQSQIKRLDSTQVFLINKLAASNQNVNIENFDLGSIYQQMIFLEKELTMSLEELDNVVEFKVVSYVEVTSKKLFWKYLNLGIIVWVVFLMFLFVRYIW